MSYLKDQQAGFGAVGIVAVVLVLLVLAGTGFVVLRKNAASNSAATTPLTSPESAKAVTQSPTQPQAAEDLYEGMKQYANDKYGISFYYPDDWSVEEVPVENPIGPVPIEFAVNVNVDTTDKYKAAASFEVVAKSYAALSEYYNSVYRPAEMFKVVKSQGITAGKQSTHFTNTSEATRPPSKSEHSLYAVGDKTYSLRSINEELNLTRHADYWKKFNQIAKSVKLR